MDRLRNIIALPVTAAIVLAACTPWSGSMSVTVILPGLPPAWADADGWELSWESPDGAGGSGLVGPGAAIELDLPRSGEAVVLCRAVYGTRRTLPYGATWPQGLRDDGVLRPDAAGGWAASLAAAFYRAGCRVCPLDLERLAREVEARLADPWDLDPVALAPVVADLRFRVDYLRAPARVAVSMTGLPCAMAPDSPWGQPLAPDEAGLATSGMVTGRVRRWIGGGYELSAAVSPSGDAVWTLSGPE